ncbi:MAG: PhzF family phenazine biosynthesis protein, partial [Verrucomicrobiota bacterium]|nr:PhzF family phenazine biosynthesis protein [Verrucomicrobiota bacterium]
AVFTDARGLDAATMQKIAREMNLSETAFVLPPQTATGTRAVRIFTPDRELPFAGHPTIGTAFVLAAIADIAPKSGSARIVLEEGVGAVEVVIRFEGGVPIFAELTAAKLPEEGPPAPSIELLAAALSLDAAQLRDGERRPRAFSCGVPFLFVTVRDLAALAQARPNLALWERHLAGYFANEIYLLTEDAGDADVRARMFAPSLGIMEDPATGSAASALAGYLAPTHPVDGTLRWTIRQGVEMGRPSTIKLAADFTDGEVSAVRVGGSAVMVSEGVLRLSE